MQVSANYFDGRSARNYEATVTKNSGALRFSDTKIAEMTWNIAGLHPINPPSSGQPFRLAHKDNPGARLVVRHQTFINILLAGWPHLKGGFSRYDIVQILNWIFGDLLPVAVVEYLALALLPAKLQPCCPTHGEIAR